MKVQKNNRKLFVGIEPRMGKNIKNMSMTMYKSIATEGKDWIRNNYGTTFLCVNDVEYESSVMLHEQHMPDKTQDVEEHLNETIRNQKKNEHEQQWNINTNMHMPKESTQEETLLEIEENDNKHETSGDEHRDRKSAIGEMSDSNCNECVGTN